jgi:hypothetical protein
MGQQFLSANVAVKLKNAIYAATQLVAGQANELIVSRGGLNTKLNQTVAAVINAAPGRLAVVTIVSPGSTGGAFTINDCLTTGAAAASNVLWSLTYNSSLNVSGAVFTIDLPAAVGIVLSAVPTGGSPIISISYS